MVDVAASIPPWIGGSEGGQILQVPPRFPSGTAPMVPGDPLTGQSRFVEVNCTQAGNVGFILPRNQIYPVQVKAGTSRQLVNAVGIDPATTTAVATYRAYDLTWRP